MSDDVLRRAFQKQRRSLPSGIARAVHAGGGFILHPDDRDAQLTRIETKRDKPKPEGRR